MNRDQKEGLRFGILGGGQLSLMLVDAARKMGYHPRVLVESPLSPVAQNYSNVIVGSLNDVRALEGFFSQVDCVLFENEFVDCDLLHSTASRYSVQFFPPLDVIRQVQDKLFQKEILNRAEVPTAPYQILKFDQNLRGQVEKWRQEFNDAVVLKWSRMGYDGKGVYRVELEKPDFQAISHFCQQAQDRNSKVYVEQAVPFVRELAVMGVRSIHGEWLFYPTVVSEQKEGVCARIFGPATEFGLDRSQEEKVQSYVKKIGEAVGLVGSFGVEFFELPNGELWVNEIAPRVHNSGHYTQNACETDQFENHWRAIIGMRLGEVRTWGCFAMLNILGPKGLMIDGQLKHRPTTTRRSHLHWYGKDGIRWGRKMGHLNGVTQKASEIPELFQELESSYQKWIDDIFKSP